MKFNKLSPKQAEIFTFPYQDYDALICDGAVRSGKSSMMTVSFILWAMENFNGCNFGICGKSVQSAERNLIAPFQAVRSMARKYRIKYLRSRSLMIVEYLDKVNFFYVFGGRDESSYTLIQGITLAGVLFDEVALMPRSFVEQGIARTLSIDNAKLWFNCNPAHPSHWFYTEWVLQAEKHRAKHLHFLMSDNPSLSPKALERAASAFSGVFYERYVLGRWVQSEGLCYPLFADNPQRFRVKEVPRLSKIIIGLDWGGNKSFHAFTATGITPNYAGLVVLRTEKHTATGTTPDDVFKLYRAFEDKIIEQYGMPDAIYPDSAEQVLLNGLRDYTTVPVYNSFKPPIIDRIRLENMLMARDRLFLTADCKSLEDALCSAVWDEKKQDDVRLDDGTCGIDEIDSWEYSFTWHMDFLIEQIEKEENDDGKVPYWD